MRWFYALQGLGALSAFIFIVGSLGIFAYLVVQDSPNAWLSLIPAIIISLARQSFILKKIPQNYQRTNKSHKRSDKKDENS